MVSTQIDVYAQPKYGDRMREGDEPTEEDIAEDDTMEAVYQATKGLIEVRNPDEDNDDD